MDEKLKQEIIELVKQFDNRDSITIGNSKTGEIKVYCDFNKPEESKVKISKAIEILREQRKNVFE